MFTIQNKPKIINDSVLGFISIPNEFIYDLIQHPFVQRLSRIKQLGLAHVVYPGAQHTRFQHSLGAMHLAGEALRQLREKGHVISGAEANGVMAAMLLHDIGHGPFSHVLERTLVGGVPHEEVSLMLMRRMNSEYEGRLATAISIFSNQYERRFLHRLISSQLDMDRLDYLRRDAFYTGVNEGNIGTARVIKMLEVFDDELVIEAKGIYSIENFLIARRFMYWQVYLHKTSVAAEKMLVSILLRAKELVGRGEPLDASRALRFFLSQRIGADRFRTDAEALDMYAALDDSDVMCAVKSWMDADDAVLRTLAGGFVNRRLFKAVDEQEAQYYDIEALRRGYMEKLGISYEETSYLVMTDKVSSSAYNPDGASIMVLGPENQVHELSQMSQMLNVDIMRHTVEKNYLFFLPI